MTGFIIYLPNQTANCPSSGIDQDCFSLLWPAEVQEASVGGDARHPAGPKEEGGRQLANVGSKGDDGDALGLASLFRVDLACKRVLLVFCLKFQVSKIRCLFHVIVVCKKSLTTLDPSSIG